MRGVSATGVVSVPKVVRNPNFQTRYRRVKGIKIRLKAFNHHELEAYSREIASAVYETGGQLRGAIRLPTRRTHFTVNRSPHVNKKSREQFKMETHKRLMLIPNPNDETVAALGRIDQNPFVEISISLVDDIKEELPIAAE